MTRKDKIDQIKHLAAIIAAEEEGKIIQVCELLGGKDNYKWTDLSKPTYNLAASRYRVKPEAKYVPFGPEDWKQFFGIPIKRKDCSITIYSVSSVYKDWIKIGAWKSEISYMHAFEQFEFMDGTPFGVQV